MTMRTGGSHKWKYRSNWHEKKVKKGTWRFVNKQTKFRKGERFNRKQGAPVGSTYIWDIKAKQRMTKTGPNTYKGEMVGTKRFMRRLK